MVVGKYSLKDDLDYLWNYNDCGGGDPKDKKEHGKTLMIVLRFSYIQYWMVIQL